MLCRYVTHLFASSDSAAHFEAVGSPQRHGLINYVATLPTCGPLVILPPTLKRWGHPRGQGLCSHLGHLWATSHSAPCSEAVGTPQAAGIK